MGPLKRYSAGLLLFSLCACEVTVKTDNAETEANKVDLGPQANEGMQATQRDPVEQFNAQAERRARELALQAGTEQQRMQSRQQAREQLQNVRFEVDILSLIHI